MGLEQEDEGNTGLTVEETDSCSLNRRPRTSNRVIGRTAG